MSPPPNDDAKRLAGIYAVLRERLLDLTLRNRMLNYGQISTKSKSQLRIVDEVPDQVYRRLAVEELSSRVRPLPDPPAVPKDEQTEDFLNELAHQKVTDQEYVERIATLDSDDPENESRFEEAEAALRDKVRVLLGLPQRKSPREINRAEHARQNGIDPSFELPAAASKEAHADAVLQTLRYPAELDAVLDRLRANARLAEQEMGLSTLFLAFGFLEWTQAESSSKRLHAPLLLFPVALESTMRNGRETFHVAGREGEAEVNLSLQKFLEKEWGLKLPDFAPGDDEKQPVEGYFERLRKMLAADDTPGWIRQRWRVRSWLILGQFAFGRLAMYADLDPKRWKGVPFTHPLIASVLRGTDGTVRTVEEAFGPPANYDIDDPAIELQAPWLVQDADASQHSAVIDAMKGGNLVIHGPPGTGKSQTIVNIIANALAAGKKVLFLAEKQAALDVVKRRLEEARLGEFCLELHSDKLTPKAVVKSISERIEIGFSGRPAKPFEDSGWASAKRGMRTYLDELHRAKPDGATPFADIWMAVTGQREIGDAFARLRAAKLPVFDLGEASRRPELLDMVQHYAAQAGTHQKENGHPADSPWWNTPLENVNSPDLADLLDNLAALLATAGEIEQLIARHAADGFAAEADCRRAIEADQLLPREAPSVAPFRDFAPSELDAALRLAREVLSAESLAAELPRIEDLSSAALASLRQLGGMSLPDDLLSKTPAELASGLPTQLRLLESRAETAATIAPVLAALGFETALPLGIVRIVADGLGLISGETANWLSQHSGACFDTGFANVYSRWSALLDAEQRWRERFPSKNQSWPDVQTLKNAADGMELGWLQKLLGGYGRFRQQVEAACHDLGIALGDLDSADLRSLASHVEALLAFENDAAASEALDTAWSGLNTRFRELATAREEIENCQRQLSNRVEGRLVCDRLFALARSDISRLAELRIAFAGFKSAFADSETELESKSLGVLGESALHEASAIRAVLQTGIPSDLERFEISLRALLQSLATAEKLVALRDRIAASQVGCVVGAFVKSAGDADKAQAASDWLGKLRRCNLPKALHERLVSLDASTARQTLAEIASDAQRLITSKQARVEHIEGPCNFLHLADIDLATLKTKLRPLVEAKAQARDLLTLKKSRALAAKAGLQDFLSQYEASRLGYERIHDVLLAMLAYHAAQRAVRDGIALDRAGAQHEAVRDQFKQRDAEKVAHDRAQLRLKLLKCSPPPGSRSGRKKEWTELALLENEVPKGKRHVPVRTLLSQAGRAIQELKPCFMMSPLSLAKFSGDRSLKFDLLVIDEASQMKPEDALGGLLRVGQVVVVGDRKQLPPTDFFARTAATDADDDDGDATEESILENCETAFGRTRRLSWHYRSRCESLIRFANKHFYDNRLVTFPAPAPGSFAIDHVRVAGNYRAGRNEREAGAIVEAAIRFMREHSGLAKHELPSLGLVAINSQQRDLIFEEFSRRGASEPEVRTYLDAAREKGEEFFIKNLENVQGDERDYIYISMTYGAEPGAAAMHQRFGPINGIHGHRRLNVLFSRARIRIGLFTSFGSADVVPTEASREGVHVLKRYLEFVEAKGASLADTHGGGSESPFETEVKTRLEARGFLVDTQVGVSGYRIDLGVRRHDEPTRYLAGIECDGAAYHASRSMRDRDRLREQVLRGLGWEILRVWSTDWLADSEAELEKLAKRLFKLNEKQSAHPSDFPLLIVEAAQAPEPVQERESAEEPVLVVTEVPPVESQNSLPLKLNGRVALTAGEARELLAAFRDTVIKPSSSGWDASRSILRDSMIEAFVAQKFDDSEDWARKVPMYLRQGTAPAEKIHLDKIAEIMARIA